MAVVDIREAIRLADAGIDADILILNGIDPADSLWSIGMGISR